MTDYDIEIVVWYRDYIRGFTGQSRQRCTRVRGDIDP